MGMIGNAPVAGTIGTANIQDGGVATADIADGAVTSAKLASTAVTDKLGYTPVNKAGDTITGNTEITAQLKISGNLASISPAAIGIYAGRDPSNTNNIGIEVVTGATGYGWLDFANGSGADFKGRVGYDGNLNKMYLISNGVSGIEIDSVGRLAMPNQPMYSGKFSGSGTQTGGLAPIKYDTTYVHVGSCYSSSTGLFTAPVAGTYLAIVQSLNNNVAGYMAMQLYMGGGIVANSWSVTDAAASVQSMVVLQAAKTLGQGDTVYVNMVTSKASNYMAETYNIFTVIKIA